MSQLFELPIEAFFLFEGHAERVKPINWHYSRARLSLQVSMKSPKLFKYITIGLGILGVSIFITLWSAGAFAEVEIQQGQQGGYLLIGSDHQGAYQNIGPVFSKVKEAQFQNGLDSAMFRWRLLR